MKILTATLVVLFITKLLMNAVFQVTIILFARFFIFILSLKFVSFFLLNDWLIVVEACHLKDKYLVKIMILIKADTRGFQGFLELLVQSLSVDTWRSSHLVTQCHILLFISDNYTLQRATSLASTLASYQQRLITTRLLNYQQQSRFTFYLLGSPPPFLRIKYYDNYLTCDHQTLGLLIL